MITYRATGIVLGNCWDGGICGYAASTITATNRASLVQQIENGIKDGSLDSGTGFESLIGAVMVISTIDTREIDGKTFIATEDEIEVYGDLTPGQEKWLKAMSLQLS